MINFSAFSSKEVLSRSDEASCMISKFENFFYEKMILDITAIKDYKDIKNIQNISIKLDASKIILLLDNSVETSSKRYISDLVSMGIYNFTQNKDGILYLLDHQNSYKDVANLQQLDKGFIPNNNIINMTRADENKTRVLGIRNLTNDAGASTLIYMLKKQLEANYTVFAIEIDKKDFRYFNDKNMISTANEDLGKELLKLNGNVDIVLIDLNTSNNEKACNDVLYLVEPSILKINELITKDNNVFANLLDKKVILNRSLLSQKDVEEFEMEAGIRIFFSIPPLNDRERSLALDKFLVKLGFLKQDTGNSSGKENKLFGIFK